MTTEKKPLGLKGIIQSLKETKLKVDLWRTFAIALILLVALGYIWDWQWFELLKKGAESLLEIYGGLLGMSIAAYALLIGIPKFRQLTGHILGGDSISLYIKIHAQFAMYLLLQVFTLAGVFITLMIINAPESPSKSTGINYLDQGINIFVLFTLFSSFLYQMTLIWDSFIIIYNGAILAESLPDK